MSVKLNCKNGCCVEFQNMDELQDVLVEARCSNCGANLASMKPKSLGVRCPCGFENGYTLDELIHYFDYGCPNADPEIDNPVAVGMHNLTFKDSYYGDYSDFDWGGSKQNPMTLLRLNREDFWEYLMHFTDWEGFKSIMEDGVILPSATGYFYKTDPNNAQAVCLTETPAQWGKEFFKEYGEFAFVFKKSDLQMLGGLPVSYLNDAIISVIKKEGKFPDAFKPFIQLLRTSSTLGKEITDKDKYDWLHNREWRVPVSIPLNKVQPVGVMFKDKPSRGQGSDVDKLKLKAALKWALIE